MKISFDHIAENKRWSILLLTALSALFFLGLGNTHLFDWDEINFAESAREMMASGDYLRVQVNFEPFWEKPPFFIWLQVLSMKTFGVNAFGARFPNALFGAIYLISIYLIGRKHFSPRFGLLWALVFVGSLLPNVYFRSGIMDPVFNYFIFMSVYFMIRVISNPEENRMGRLALLAGVFNGLSVITKGPVGFLLLGLTLFVYLLIKRFKPFPKWKHIFIFLGGLLAIIAIWLTFEFAKNGFEIIRQFIAYQAELFNSDVAGHAQPFYYHFVVVFFGCFPISILAIPSLFKKRSEVTMDFHLWMLCLFWVVLILFSIVTTKIIHYSSMTWVPLSFVAAYTLYLAQKKEIRLRKWSFYLYAIIGILVSGAFIGVAYILIHNAWFASLLEDRFVHDCLMQPLNTSLWAYSTGVFLLIGVGLGIFFLFRGKFVHFAVSTVLSVTIALGLAQWSLLPSVERMTQGASIEYFEQMKRSDKQVTTFQFKSYGQYFYREIDTKTKELNAFMEDPIQDPVYFVVKSDNDLIQEYNYVLVSEKGGFKLYRRDPELNQ